MRSDPLKDYRTDSGGSWALRYFWEWDAELLAEPAPLDREKKAMS